MSKIILTRHGHVEGIHPWRFRGRMELPLTALGREQAALTGARIASEWQPVAIYTSPMGRCRETGEAIAKASKLASVAVLEDLNDFDYGEWQWRTNEEVRAAYPALHALWLSEPHLARPPKGEALQDLVSRTANALRYVLEQHATETVVLVGHDSVNRALMLQLLDQPLSAYWRLIHSPCGVTEIDIVAGDIEVRRVNETSHLSACNIWPAALT